MYHVRLQKGIVESRKSGTVLVIPGHQNTQERKITYDHLMVDWNTEQPKERWMIVLQFAHDPWSWVSCIHKSLSERIAESLLCAMPTFVDMFCKATV